MQIARKLYDMGRVIDLLRPPLAYLQMDLIPMRKINSRTDKPIQSDLLHETRVTLSETEAALLASSQGILCKKWNTNAKITWDRAVTIGTHRKC